MTIGLVTDHGEDFHMDFKLPELGEGVYEAEAVRWLVQAGQPVRPGQTLLEVLTDKATMEVPAPFAGTVQDLLVEPGQKIAVGDVILHYDDKKGARASHPSPSGRGAGGEGKTESKAKAPVAAPPPVPVRDNGPVAGHAAVKAAPSVRLMARKLGIDLAQIRGTGPAGRILIDDLVPSVGNASGSPAAPKPPAADYGKPGTRIKFVALRRMIAEHMVQSKRTIPHYSYVDECDVTDLVKLREGLKEAFAARGAKLTYVAFFVKAVVAALKEVPIVNASLNEEAGEIVLHDHYHIGIAVATPGGLIVPVVRDADKKGIIDIAKEIERLTQDARVGKSQLDDLRGGTFSITSIGNIGGLFATPIILSPQVGIVCASKIVKRPIYDEHGRLKPADMVYLSFSFDHRVLDGAVGAAFGNAVIKHLQNPAALLL
jgi:pyruvate dehydrogenase E2 component (dihydrolipoamide acetyltransferase)/2-oxoisovalerate dehydrogenase E2 component (dihydrolipoyl transacylase)